MKQAAVNMKTTMSKLCVQMMLEMSAYSMQGDENNPESKKHVSPVLDFLRMLPEVLLR